MIYSVTNKLSEIIHSDFRAVSVFEKYSINYYTNGNRTLTEACESINAKPALLLSELKNLNGTCSDLIRAYDWKPDFLCDYIVINHHSYIRKMFPVMMKLLRKISGDRIRQNSHQITIKEFEKMETDFEIHMQKEEKLLFPYIKRLKETGSSGSDFEIAPFGLIKEPVNVMKREHTAAIEKINRLRYICSDQRVPKSESKLKENFCRLFRKFEQDFHIHLYLENTLLFPKAILLERKILKNKSINKSNISK